MLFPHIIMCYIIVILAIISIIISLYFNSLCNAFISSLPLTKLVLEMVGVAVCGDENFLPRPRFLGKLHRDLVRLFGRELLRRRNGLRVLVEKYPVSLAVNLLRCHKFMIGICSVAVDSADQLPFRSAVKGLIFLLTIVDNGSHRGRILSAFFDENYCRHVSSSPIILRIAS